MSEDLPEKGSQPMPVLPELPDVDPRRGGSLSAFLHESQAEQAGDFDYELQLELAQYGDRVRFSRKALGLTQADLARMTGIAQPRISAIEAGSMENGPSFRTMARLARALGNRELGQIRSPRADVLVHRTALASPGKELVTLLRTAMERGVSTKWLRDGRSEPLLNRVVCVSPDTAPGSVTIGGNKFTVRDCIPAQLPHVNDYVRINGFATAIPARPDAIETLNETPNFLVIGSEPGQPPLAINVLGVEE